jgi:hypothetical protein
MEVTEKNEQAIRRGAVTLCVGLAILAFVIVYLS